MPDTDGDVGDRVGIELLLFDIVAQVVLIPTAVGELHVAQPAIGSSGFGMQTDNVERHRSLDMVPRITVTAGKPRHLSGWKLEVGDGLAGGADLIGSDDAVDRRDSELRLHVLHSNRGPVRPPERRRSFRRTRWCSCQSAGQGPCQPIAEPWVDP